MKNSRVGLLLVGALIGLGACGKIEDPQFRKLDSFVVKKAGLSETEIGFSVTYYNPNNFGVSVKEAEADFYVDSVFVGKFIQDTLVEVARKAEFSIGFTGTVPLMTLLSLNRNDLMNREVPVRANGSVKVGKAGVFLSRPFIYQGRHKLDVRL